MWTANLRSAKFLLALFHAMKECLEKWFQRNFFWVSKTFLWTWAFAVDRDTMVQVIWLASVRGRQQESWISTPKPHTCIVDLMRWTFLSHWHAISTSSGIWWGMLESSLIFSTLVRRDSTFWQRKLRSWRILLVTFISLMCAEQGGWLGSMAKMSS